uniref:Venom cystatin 5 n=1 Tax=Oncocephalus sp. TaxID=2944721 RepID=A0AB38ZEQ3_9HEMI
MFKSAVIILILGSVFLLECDAEKKSLSQIKDEMTKNLRNKTIKKVGGLDEISVDDKQMKNRLRFMLSQRNAGLKIVKVISAKKQTTIGAHYVITFVASGGAGKQTCNANFTVRGSGDKLKMLGKGRLECK